MAKPKGRYALGLLGLTVTVVAAVVAGVVAGYAVSTSLFGGGQRATAGPGTPPTPPPIAEQVRRLVEADAAKPKFVGELNGITFFDPEQTPPQWPEGCSRENTRTIADQEEVAAAVASSPLDFTPTYLPAGYKLVHQEATMCGVALVSISRGYEREGSPSISISRDMYPPYYLAVAPLERLEATTINGRRAVIIKPVFANDLSVAIMTGQDGTWLVHASLGVAELVKIAEGLK